jgi:hypothetical protein
MAMSKPLDQALTGDKALRAEGGDKAARKVFVTVGSITAALAASSCCIILLGACRSVVPVSHDGGRIKALYPDLHQGCEAIVLLHGIKDDEKGDLLGVGKPLREILVANNEKRRRCYMNS